MVTTQQARIEVPLYVPSGKDRFGDFRWLGISRVTFKVASQDSQDLFIIEIHSHKKGGPSRHFHYGQDEWFYVVEGSYIFEAAEARFQLQPGDSFLIPRMMPHAWAFVGDAAGRLLITFTPARNMEGFFREISKANAMPSQDPDLWHRYGMELLGPPIPLD